MKIQAVTFDELASRAARLSGRRFDIVGLGQNSLDHVCRVGTMPAAGQKIEAEAYQVLAGGQVATAVLAACRMGVKAAYRGGVGDGPQADLVCSRLRQCGVELHLKKVAGATGQSAVILVDGGGERTIIQHYDPQTVVRADDLEPTLFGQTRALHLDITDIPAAIRAATWARQAGAVVSLDIDRILPGVDDLLPLVDLLVASENLPKDMGSRSPDHALEDLAGQCPGVLCVTLGAQGCLVLESETFKKFKAFSVDPLDSTGCGDVFRGALLAGLLRNEDLARAMRHAAAAAALQTQTVGAQAGAPSRADVKAFLGVPPPFR